VLECSFAALWGYRRDQLRGWAYRIRTAISVRIKIREPEVLAEPCRCHVDYFILHGAISGAQLIPKFIGLMARPKRFELLTPRFVVWKIDRKPPAVRSPSGLLSRTSLWCSRYTDLPFLRRSFIDRGLQSTALCAGRLSDALALLHPKCKPQARLLSKVEGTGNANPTPKKLSS
jgi:hypothetical protein